MRPLTFDDLLPLSEYAGKRHEFFESHTRYLDRYRRVRVGPRVTLIFENRQTLWYRIQEILRVARLSHAERVQQELEMYNRLLPGKSELRAALLIEVSDKTRLEEELASWQDFRGPELRLCVGAENMPAMLITSRPEDHAIGAAHWVQFSIATEQRHLLTDLRTPAHFEMRSTLYRHDSPPLNDEVRQSLLDDLELSDRD